MTREQIRLAVKETTERLAKDLPSSPNRLVGKDLHRELLRLRTRKFSTWAAKVIATIRELADTADEAGVHTVSIGGDTQKPSHGAVGRSNNREPPMAKSRRKYQFPRDLSYAAELNWENASVQ
jgi:hypothetical protein